MKSYVAFCAILAVAAGGVREKRGFLSGLHSLSSYSAPAVSYSSAPVLSRTVSYSAPAVSYSAPIVSHAPYVSHAPIVSHAPLVSYSSPAVSSVHYSHPVVHRYIAPSVHVHRVAPVVHRTVVAPVYPSRYASGW